MPAYIYRDGSFHPMADQKMFHNGAWTRMPKLARIYLDSQWHYLGNVVRPAQFYSNVISAGTAVCSAHFFANSTTIQSGGTAYDMSASGDKIVCVSRGGYAISCTMLQSSVLSVSGGIADHATIFASASVHSGGTLTNTSGGGRITVNSGGFASGFVVSGYYGQMHLFVSSGGSAEDITVRSGNPLLYVEPGAVCSDIFISSGGIMTAVMPTSKLNDYATTGFPGSASKIEIYSGGSLQLTSGTVFDVTVYSGGALSVASGSFARYITVHSGGTLTAAGRGGTVTNLTCHEGAVIYGFNLP